MRHISGLMALLVLVSAGPASAQAVELHASAGPTISDAGNSVSVGAGLSPHPRLTIVVGVERTHLSSRTSREDGVISSFRGGALLLGTAELRVAPFGRGRFGPFGLAGFAAGVSHPNVNETFPDRITNTVGAMILGGGIQAPLGEQLAIFADARMMVGAEGREGVVGVAPVRAGIARRF